MAGGACCPNKELRADVYFNCLCARRWSRGGDIIGLMFPLLMIVVIFWLLVWRPQKKRQDEHRAMVAAVRRGDAVVTSGGIIGKVAKVVDDNEIVVEVAENVKMRFQKAAILEVRTKGEPVKDDAKKK